MNAGDMVRHRETGEIGVILSTINLLRRDGPWSVIFNGSGISSVVEDESEFEIIGRYDAAPDEKGCGMGQGEECCRFLGVTSRGMTCLRFGDSHWGRVFNAKGREPKLLYPDCKLSE